MNDDLLLNEESSKKDVNLNINISVEQDDLTRKFIKELTDTLEEYNKNNSTTAEIKLSKDEEMEFYKQKEAFLQDYFKKELANTEKGEIFVVTDKYEIIITNVTAHNNLSPKNHAATLIKEIKMAITVKLARLVALITTTNRHVIIANETARSTHKSMVPKCQIPVIGSYIGFFSFKKAIRIIAKVIYKINKSIQRINI